MNNKYDPNKSELIISSNRNLAVKKSSVIKRGLELVNELVVREEKEQKEWEKIATEAMKKLMDEGVPYHKGIEGVIGDCEFHYQIESRDKCYSAIKTFGMLLSTDAPLHSQAFNLTSEIGIYIFHYWAITFHQKDYEILMKEARDIEGISWKLEKIINELKSYFKEEEAKWI